MGNHIQNTFYRQIDHFEWSIHHPALSNNDTTSLKNHFTSIKSDSAWLQSHFVTLQHERALLHRESLFLRIRFLLKILNFFLKLNSSFMNSNTIDGALLFAQNAISYSLNQPLLKSLLEEYGYTAERIQEGESLNNSASEANKVHKKEYGEQYEATYELNETKVKAGKVYMKHLKVARIALGNDPGPVNALQLAGARSRTLSGWLSQVKAFYSNALNDPSILEALGKYMITEEKLKTGQDAVFETEQKFNKRLKEKGEDQNATKVRDKAMDELDKWISEFTGIARIALEENPQYLEMLGIVAPSQALIFLQSFGIEKPGYLARFFCIGNLYLEIIQVYQQ